MNVAKCHKVIASNTIISLEQIPSSCDLNQPNKNQNTHSWRVYECRWCSVSETYWKENKVWLVEKYMPESYLRLLVLSVRPILYGSFGSQNIKLENNTRSSPLASVFSSYKTSFPICWCLSLKLLTSRGSLKLEAKTSTNVIYSRTFLVHCECGNLSVYTLPLATACSICLFIRVQYCAIIYQ